MDWEPNTLTFYVDGQETGFLRPATCIAQCICWPTWQFRLRRTRPTRRSLLTSTISAHTLHPTLSPASTILSAKAALQRQVARPMQEPADKPELLLQLRPGLR